VSAGARIHDVRYGRWEGRRRGRLAAVWALARWSALRSLGARRGWRAKLVPVSLALLAFAPAFIILGLRGLFAAQLDDVNFEEILPYGEYQTLIGIDILVFAAVTAPELLCLDRRDGTLPLLFSTSVSRLEYVAGKVLAAIVPMLVVTLLPVLFLYFGNVLFALHPVGYLESHAGELPRIVLAGALIAVFYALIGLAVASLTSRRAFAIGGYLALMIIPVAAVGILEEAFFLDDRWRLLGISDIPLELTIALFDDAELGTSPPGGRAYALAYAAVMAVAAAVLAWRYRPAET
jgi:ABC-2 type transport system permease protein